jgi:hypothetical protein
MKPELSNVNQLTFEEVLQILGISEYETAIMNSNSHGELFFIEQYYRLASIIGKTLWFSRWFKMKVRHAKLHWKRPESVYQHLIKLLADEYNETGGRCVSHYTI